MAGEQEEAIRRDPEVQQARRIADAARARLLECLDNDGADALAEAQQMLEALRKATELAENAEDRARVHLGLLTQDGANRRAAVRHASFDPRAPGEAPEAHRRAAAKLALTALVAAAAAWLAARLLTRRRNGGR